MDKRQLSLAQIEQRRLAGKSLSAKVDRDYYKFIGRRGGRRTQFNQLMQLATAWTPSADLIAQGKSPAHTERFIAAMREQFMEEAYDKYFDFSGNRLMLYLWRKEVLNDRTTA